MKVVQACNDHVRLVMEILSECNTDMRRRGIYQWDDVYPDLGAVAKDASEQTLYVALVEDCLVGAVCLSEEQDEAYSRVHWLGREPVLVVHRLCVAPARQGRGIASRIMDFAEELAEKKGYAGIRLDAYTGNEKAFRLYDRRGYRVAGRVFFPRRELPFYCMEKELRRGTPP
jgi:ribosomal protein S18 acetylase RimI-like enzyme